MEVLEFIKNLTSAEFIVNWGSLMFLVFLVFAECTLLVGFLLPGNSLIFVSGASCALQPSVLNVHLIVLILLLSAAALMGYWFGYWFGERKMGPRCLKPNTNIKIFQQRSIDFTVAYYEKHGGKTLIIGRYLPLIRNFAPVIAGMIKMDFRRYMFYNVIGAFLWISSLASLGYYFGSQPFVKDRLDFVLIGSSVMIFAYLYFIKKTKTK
jgi:membrane-associated protein